MMRKPFVRHRVRLWVGEGKERCFLQPVRPCLSAIPPGSSWAARSLQLWEVGRVETPVSRKEGNLAHVPPWDRVEPSKAGARHVVLR